MSEPTRHTKGRRRTPEGWDNARRLATACLRFLSIAFAIVPCLMLVRNLFSDPLPDEFARSSRVQPEVVSFDQQPNDASHKAILVTTFRRFTPATRQVEADIRLYLTKAIRSSLTNVRDNTMLFGGPTDPSAPPPTLPLVIRYTDRFSARSELVRVDLDHHQPRSSAVATSEPDFSGSAKFDVSGDPSRYPSDWYWFSRFFDVELLAPFASKPAPGQFVYVLDVEHHIKVDANMQDRAVHVGLPAKSPSEVTAFVVNDVYTKWYIYVMALIPLALAMRALLLGVVGEARIIEIGALLIAVLPLRVVLVPADVPGITRVDLLLGLAVGLSATSVVFSGSALSWPQLRPRAADKE